MTKMKARAGQTTLCRAPAPVLDCANGYQKEDQEKADEIENKCPSEDDAAKDAGAEGKNT
jgi:hypothetical protein